MIREDLKNLTPEQRWLRHVERQREYARAYMPGYVRRRYATEPAFRAKAKKRARAYYRANRERILSRLRDKYKQKKKL